MNLTDKNALLESLADANRRVAEWFSALPADEFFSRHADVWSPSDNLDHLIKAVKPVTLALKMPAFSLHTMFGKPEEPSRSYEEICERYRNEIAKGAQASGRYLPKQESPSEKADEGKSQLIETWKKAGRELVFAAQAWDEADLDKYQLPHPILGALTVREMLFFTIYHNLRHASLEGD